MAEEEEEGGVKKAGKFFKRLFVAEDDTPAEAPEASTAPAAPVVPVSRNAQTFVPPPVVSSAVAADPMAVEKIMNACKKVGTDYDRVLAMAATFTFLPDEGTRFLAAVTALEQTQGLQRSQVVAAIDERLLALQGEEEKFARAYQSRVGAFKTQEDQIKSNDEEIKRLSRQIEELKASSVQIKQAIDTGRTEIDRAKTGFALAANEVRSRLTAEKDRLTRLLNQGGR